MTKYLFIIVFGAVLLLTAVADEYKMHHKVNYNDELAIHIAGLKSFIPSSGILHYSLNDPQFSEPVIRSRFVLAPYCILIPENPAQHCDTLLLINRLQDSVVTGSAQKVLWSYTDTLARYTLVNYKKI